MTYKPLFSRALAADPDRLHYAAHSHHLWPDASFEGQMRAWTDANANADRKWDLIFSEVVPEAQGHVARELNLPSTDSLVFSSNTHDFLIRIVSGFERKPVRILASDGEFHSFRRQAARWEEAGQVIIERVPLEPFDTFADRFVDAARRGGHDLIWVSQVFFRTGQMFDRVADLAALADPKGPWVVIDGYHGFMATPTDLGAVADRVFYLAGGYKYAMAGEGACFLHLPPGFCERPKLTGWFAEFGDLKAPPGGVGYTTDGGRMWGATFDVSGLYRFNAARRMLDEQGLTTADVAAYTRGLIATFAAMAGDGGAGALSDAVLMNPVEGEAARARFLAFRHPHAQAWQKALEARNVITDVRDDVIRFGFALYHDEADVERLAGACRSELA